MKKAVLFCTCCGTLNKALPTVELQGALSRRSLFVMPVALAPEGKRSRKNEAAATGRDEIIFVESPRLCRAAEAKAALKNAADAGAEALVAAACSLSSRGREALANLGSGLPLELVDLREACAWIHKDALAKATDLICMGLSALDQRRDQRKAPAAEASGKVAPEAAALVIGGGPAGLACAATLGQLGVPTILAERRTEVGGMLPQLGKLFPYLTSGKELLEQLKNELASSGARMETGTTVSAARASGQGYAVTLSGPDGEREINVAAVILASGAMPVMPGPALRHGKLPGVSSQMELEILLGKVERGEASKDALPGKAVLLQCVNARDEKNPYCSAICCPTALKNALRLKTLRPEASVTVLHRNIVTPGIHLEKLYRQATASGVLLRNMDPAVKPEPLGESSLEGVKFRDALDGEEYTIQADALVCSTPLKPAPKSMELAKGLGVRLDELGFACGREPILPLAPYKAGLYLCGSVRWPSTVEQSLEQGRAAAVKAAAFIKGSPAANRQDRSDLPWTIRELLGLAGAETQAAGIREEACSRCGRCALACPYGALALPEKGSMRVIPERCASCGSCAAVCPTGAPVLPEESIGAMRARISEALGGKAI